MNKRFILSFFILGIVTATLISYGLVTRHIQGRVKSPSGSVTAQEPAYLPQVLQIPHINVQAAVEPVGLDQDRRMDVPKAYQNVAWFRFGPDPGEVGSAVIAGHLDSPQGAAVFAKLDELKPGDEIVVRDYLNLPKVFEVEKVELYSDQNFPISEVFEKADARRLNLITCAGTFDRAKQLYSDRLVVFSKLKES
jgi:sortase A